MVLRHVWDDWLVWLGRNWFYKVRHHINILSKSPAMLSWPPAVVKQEQLPAATAMNQLTRSWSAQRFSKFRNHFPLAKHLCNIYTHYGLIFYTIIFIVYYVYIFIIECMTHNLNLNLKIKYCISYKINSYSIHLVCDLKWIIGCPQYKLRMYTRWFVIVKLL